jgi:predicted ATPase/class 3 adenylate cyclase
MRQLPSGTVTFLFSDIEGSTRLLDELGRDAYAAELAEHRQKMRDAFTAQGGVEVDTQGDAFFVAFPTASGALAAAGDAQAVLAEGPIRVRMGIHSGEPLLTEEGYVGIDVHRGARVMSAGHGGQVLVSYATHALAGSEFMLRDLGRHRLKDLTEPQPLYQLGDGDFPPPKTLSQTNLPAQPTPLVGREAELADVLRLLRENRLVTLTGAGGSGKTRLALQAAAELVEDNPDGVWWVSLAPLRDPELVESTIAQAVGAENGLGDHLRERQALLLLDNFEQVVDAARDIGRLLSAAPSVRILATSRERLALAGEHEYPVPTLPPTAGVALFTARARQLKPNFAPDQHVREICRRLDGLPLAIELAAARVKVLTAEQILARVSKSLELLTTGGRDADARHRTLRATIEWSYELLQPEEKELFARLAVFAGSFALEGAEAVCDAGVDTLGSLLDKSLLRETGDGRFFMLETLREYAQERLEARSEADALRQRHAEYVAQLVRTTYENLRRPGEEEWLIALAADHENLRAASAWAHQEGRYKLALEIAAFAAHYWYVRGHVYEGLRNLEHVLGHAERESSRVYGLALHGAGVLASSQGDYGRAIGWAEEAASLLSDHGTGREPLLALNALAAVLVDAGDRRRAKELLARGLAMARAEEDEYVATGFLANMCNLALIEHDYAGALELGRECSRIAQKLGAQHPLAIAQSNMGIAELGLGNLATAESLFADGLETASGHGITEAEAWCIAGLAAVAARRGDDETAARYLGLVLLRMEETGVVFEPAERELLDETRETTEASLGPDRFANATETGRSLDARSILAMLGRETAFAD